MLTVVATLQINTITWEMMEEMGELHLHHPAAGEDLIRKFSSSSIIDNKLKMVLLLVLLGS